MESHGIYRDMNYIVLWNVFEGNNLSMLIGGCFWCGMVQVNLKNHDFGHFRDEHGTWHLFTRYLHGFGVLAL